jgi:hypothetical protein
VAPSAKYVLLNNILQDFFAAHPRLLEQFPGGVVQFAQLAGHLPEEVLQEIVVNAEILEDAGAQGALPHGEMPGGLPGDNLVQLNFVEEADIDIERENPAAAGAREETPVADEAPPLLEEDEEEDEELEEVSIFWLPFAVVHAEHVCQIAPLPIRVLRNLVGRFWGSSNAEAEDGGSSDDESHREAELDGVD